MILLDTGGLLAMYDRGDQHHAKVAPVLEREDVGILSPIVLAKLDYMLIRLGGQRAEMVLLNDVARGAYQLEPFSSADVAAAIAVIHRYADLNLGLADASIMVLAERYRCLDVLTLDQRHFRAVLGPGGQPFRLLPFDAM